MKKPVQTRTEYGPFEIDVIYCDGVDCLKKGVEAYLAGWLVVQPFGIQIGTFGDGAIMHEETHYCSKDCLKKALG